MEEETEHEVRVTHASTAKTTSTFPPRPEFRNVTQPPPRPENATFTFSAGKQLFGVIAIVLAIIGAFFSVVSFSLDHAAPVQRLHQPIFSEYNLILAILIIIGLVFVHFHPQHKWIYYSIICTSIVFVLLTLANFIIHMALIDQADEDAIDNSPDTPQRAEAKSIIKIVKAGAAFTFMDGVLKVLIAIMCIVIIVLKV
uniref:MARVEL domain-containing protein n=1 Tax=Panagrolaimus davidi TaxID=227884 RepID=A0A914Q8Y4_9BILA